MAKDLNQRIKELHGKEERPSDKQIAELLAPEFPNITESVVSNRRRRMNLPLNPHIPAKQEPESNSGTLTDTSDEEEVHEPEDPKSGVDVRNDGRIIINWTNRTIVTDLGAEFGTYVCSIAKHQAIQRAYSDQYESKGENQEEVARRFNFPSTRAASRYFREHGIRHSSLPQTDLEFEEGLDVDDAVEETIQSQKRAAHKKTQQRLWKETQKDADKWRMFEEYGQEPLVALLKDSFKNYKPIKVRLPKTAKSNDRNVVIGNTDNHFMKLAFNYLGVEVYNQDIAEKILKKACQEQLDEILKAGIPAKFTIVVGSDNMHIDNIFQTTTRGTSMAGATDGDWAQAVSRYVKLTIDMIEFFAQVAPVDIIEVAGNHDYHTSVMLGVLLESVYKDRKNVSVIRYPESRTFVEYGDYCLIFDHGEVMTSRGKRDKNIHKVILAEARERGINVNKIKHYYYFCGHFHTELAEDMGVVTFYIMSSLAGDDTWHKNNAFIGSEKKLTAYSISSKDGMKSITYAKGY